MIDIYRDPIWEEMLNWFRPMTDYRLADNGLKAVIRRPHNLINIKDDEGKIVAQRLELVTTPFTKDDVKVSITDNTLSVTCGNENIKDLENEQVAYRGISSQSYSFALKLAPSVDQKRITAENRDGVLKISLPLKQVENRKPETVEIDIA